MQPNIIAGNRALGPYQRTNYGYDVATNPYRPNPRMPNTNMTHQNSNIGCITTNYVGGAPTIFSTLLSANYCNISDTIQVLHPIPSPCAVKFRKLPFCKLRYEVLKSSLLNPNNHMTLPQNVKTSATQEFQFGFVMTCAMASELAMNRDVLKNEYKVQMQLRITMVDAVNPSCSTEYDDYLPLGLVIRVNGRSCTNLPPCAPCSRQATETRRIPRPITLTHLMKISPMNANVLSVNWAPEAGKQFVITMNIIEKLSSEVLLNNLKEKPKISVDVTKLTIREQCKPIDGDEMSSGKVSMDDEEDIATTILRVSLLCPLAKFRMQYPAKGKDCTHLQCFDGSAYINLNEKKPMWNCPVCNKCLYYDDLMLDEYFMNVLQNDELSADCHEVQLFVDGSWKSYFEDTPTDSKNAAPPSSPSERGQLANSPEEGAKGKVSSSSEPAANPLAVSNNDVVDLLSDDEDVPATNEASKSYEEATVTNKNESSTNEEVPTKAANGEVLISDLAKNEHNNKMETDADVPPASAAKVKNKETNQAGGIISLDSPSPPTSVASPAHPPMADLNLNN